MIPRLIIRFVTVLLIPALIGDPLLAADITRGPNSCSILRLRQETERMQTQALSESAGWAGHQALAGGVDWKSRRGASNASSRDGRHRERRHPFNVLIGTALTTLAGHAFWFFVQAFMQPILAPSSSLPIWLPMLAPLGAVLMGYVLVRWGMATLASFIAIVADPPSEDRKIAFELAYNVNLKRLETFRFGHVAGSRHNSPIDLLENFATPWGHFEGLKTAGLDLLLLHEERGHRVQRGIAFFSQGGGRILNPIIAVVNYGWNGELMAFLRMLPPSMIDTDYQRRLDAMTATLPRVAQICEGRPWMTRPLLQVIGSLNSGYSSYRVDPIVNVLLPDLLAAAGERTWIVTQALEIAGVEAQKGHDPSGSLKALTKLASSESRDWVIRAGMRAERFAAACDKSGAITQETIIPYFTALAESAAPREASDQEQILNELVAGFEPILKGVSTYEVQGVMTAIQAANPSAANLAGLLSVMGQYAAEGQVPVDLISCVPWVDRLSRESIPGDVPKQQVLFRELLNQMNSLAIALKGYGFSSAVKSLEKAPIDAQALPVIIPLLTRQAKHSHILSQFIDGGVAYAIQLGKRVSPEDPARQREILKEILAHVEPLIGTIRPYSIVGITKAMETAALTPKESELVFDMAQRHASHEYNFEYFISDMLPYVRRLSAAEVRLPSEREAQFVIRLESAEPMIDIVSGYESRAIIREFEALHVNGERLPAAVAFVTAQAKLKESPSAVMRDQLRPLCELARPATADDFAVLVNGAQGMMNTLVARGADQKVVWRLLQALLNRGFIPRQLFAEKTRNAIVQVATLFGANLENNLAYYRTLDPTADLAVEFSTMKKYMNDVGLSIYLPRTYDTFRSARGHARREFAEKANKYMNRMVRGEIEDVADLPRDVLDELQFAMVRSTKLTRDEYDRTRQSHRRDQIPAANFHTGFRMTINTAQMRGSLSDVQLGNLRAMIQHVQEIVHSAPEEFVIDQIAQNYQQLLRGAAADARPALGSLCRQLRAIPAIRELLSQETVYFPQLQEALNQAMGSLSFDVDTALHELSLLLVPKRQNGNGYPLKAMEHAVPAFWLRTYRINAQMAERLNRILAMNAGASEAYSAISALMEFFGELAPGQEFEMRDAIERASGMAALKDMLSKFTPVNGRRAIMMEVVPSKQPLDYFYGYFGENCTSNYDAELLNPNFTPMRILIDKRIVGVVHTLSLQVDGEKWLIIPGIEPKESILATSVSDEGVNVDEFFDKLIDGLIGVAADPENHYDQLLFTTESASQSNRTPIKDRIVKLIAGKPDRRQSIQSRFPRSSVYSIEKLRAVWTRKAGRLPAASVSSTPGIRPGSLLGQGWLAALVVAPLLEEIVRAWLFPAGSSWWTHIAFAAFNFAFVGAHWVRYAMRVTHEAHTGALTRGVGAYSRAISKLPTPLFVACRTMLAATVVTLLSLYTLYVNPAHAAALAGHIPLYPDLIRWLSPILLQHLWLSPVVSNWPMHLGVNSLVLLFLSKSFYKPASLFARAA